MNKYILVNLIIYDEDILFILFYFILFSFFIMLLVEFISIIITISS